MRDLVHRQANRRRSIVVTSAFALSLTIATASQGQVTFESKSDTEINSGTSILLTKPSLRRSVICSSPPWWSTTTAGSTMLTTSRPPQAGR